MKRSGRYYSSIAPAQPPLRKFLASEWRERHKPRAKLDLRPRTPDTRILPTSAPFVLRNDMGLTDPDGPVLACTQNVAALTEAHTTMDMGLFETGLTSRTPVRMTKLALVSHLQYLLASKSLLC